MLQNKYSGFSLIELLIVIAIIGILSVFTVNNYINFQKDSRLYSFSEEFASVLKTARNKSVNGETFGTNYVTECDSGELPYWGISATTNSYTLIENCIKTDGTVYSENVETYNAQSGSTINPPVNPADPPVSTNFERLSGGKKDGVGTYTLKIPGNPDCMEVSVSSNGEVSSEKNIGCL